MHPFALAPLSATEAEHEARVRAHLLRLLREAGGWLPFERYMEGVLYAPGLGYYAAGAHKLGAGGDFITAPDLSPVFARCVAQACIPVLQSLPGGTVLEVGAGSGALACGVLAALAAAGVRPARYLILEISPDLRQRQREAVAALPPDLAGCVEWIDAPPADAFCGVILANEVLDALPVARWRGEVDGLSVLGVGAEGEALVEVARPADAAAAAAFAALDVPLDPGQEMEWCPALPAWLAAVTAPLQAGVVLLFDYGEHRRSLYRSERHRGTLVAFHRHRIHNDPFIHLGLQDLTAWVDFTAVAEAALAAGLDLVGYTTQACFLLDCGFEAQVAALQGELDEEHAALMTRTALRLVRPDDMGERFKCMALSRQYEGDVGGFGLREFSGLL